MNNEFILDIIARLNKQLSKSAINGDLKSLNNTMYVRVLAKLSKTLASKELKKQLKELDNLNINVGLNAKIDKKAEANIKQTIQGLQKSISDLEVFAMNCRISWHSFGDRPAFRRRVSALLNV